MSLRVILLAATALVATTGAASAQGNAPGANPTNLSELVVTAAPYAVSLDTATTSVDVLKREDLQTGVPAGLGDVLSHLPGLRSSSNGPGASRPVIRGFSGPRVLVLQNGLGQIDASALSPDHAVASDPAEASRIEVLRGPSALAYGGSGIGGVVNVIDDRIPSVQPVRSIEGHATVSGSTVDDGRAYGAGLTTALGPLVFSLDADHHESDDYRTPVAPLSAARAEEDHLDIDPTKIQRNADVILDTYGVGASYIGQKGYIGLSARRTASEYGVPYAQGSEHDHGDEEDHGDHDHEEEEGHEHEGPVAIHMKQTRYDLRGERRMDLGPFELVRFSAGYADYDHSEVAREGGEVHTTFQSTGTEGRLELVQGERNGWKGAVGLQGLSREFEAFGEEAFVPPSEIKEAGVFTLQRYDADTWGFDGGLRLDRRSISSTLAGRESSEAANAAGIEWASLSGEREFDNVSASLGGYVKPTQQTFYALSLSRNGRAPTEFELFADGPHPGTGGFELGSPDLKSEIVLSLEATARWEGERLRVEGHLWGAKYDGFIDRRPTGEVDAEEGLPVFAYVQTDGEFVGMEAEVEYALLRTVRGDLTISGLFDKVRGETDLGAPARTPPWSAAARLDWKGGRITAGGEVRYVAEQDRVAAFETPTDGYTLVNLKATFQPFADREWRLFGRIDNLGDVEAREHVSFLKDVAVLPGRSVRAGVTVNF